MSSGAMRPETPGLQPSSVRSRSRSPVPPRDGSQPPRAPGLRRPDPAELDEHPPREPARGGAQLSVGRGGEVGEQRRGPLRVGGQRAVERLDVELAELGRDVVERLVAGRELLASGLPGSPVAVWPLPPVGVGLVVARRALGRRAVSFSLLTATVGVVGIGGLVRVGRPEQVQQLVDHRLGRAVDAVGDADATRERRVGRVARGLPLESRLGAQRGQPGEHECEVDGTTHGRAHPDVAVGPGGPRERHRQLHDRAVQPGHRTRDHPLARLVLVAQHDPAHPVGDGLADPRRADRVERVHGGDEPELRPGRDRAEPGYGDLALGEHRDEDVQRLLGDPVELLQVEQPTAAHRRQQRTVHETRRVVALRQHLRGVERSDQPGRGELGVALHEHDLLAVGTRDRAQQGRLAGAGRALDHDVAPGLQGDRQHLALAAQTHDRGDRPGRRHGTSTWKRPCRSKDCPGTAARSSYRGQAFASWMITPRMFLPSRRSW